MFELSTEPRSMSNSSQFYAAVTDALLWRCCWSRIHFQSHGDRQQFTGTIPSWSTTCLLFLQWTSALKHLPGSQGARGPGCWRDSHSRYSRSRGNWELLKSWESLIAKAGAASPGASSHTQQERGRPGVARLGFLFQRFVLSYSPVDTLLPVCSYAE